MKASGRATPPGSGISGQHTEAVQGLAQLVPGPVEAALLGVSPDDVQRAALFLVQPDQELPGPVAAAHVHDEIPPLGVTLRRDRPHVAHGGMADAPERVVFVIVGGGAANPPYRRGGGVEVGAHYFP